MRVNTRFWLVTLACLLGMLATVSLGRWQLSRAAQKEALQAAIEQRSAMQPLSGAGWVEQDVASLLHRPVRLRGRFDPAHTLFLDNRQMHGRPGFFVLTPFRIEGGDKSIVVQRGWLPRNFIDRTALPVIPTPDGVVQLEGRIAPAPSKLFEFQKGGQGRIRQNLDLAEFSRETGLSLLPLSVLQTRSLMVGADAVVDDGLARDWPVIAAGVQTHYGYAFQWFGLATLIVVLYVRYQILRPRRRPVSTPVSNPDD